MTAGVVEFCHKALMMSPSTDLGVETVERARSSPRGLPFLETIVVFVDSFARDRVFAGGPQLAGFRDEQRKPTCGIRLQIPGHLMPQFKALESYAYTQRNNHGPGDVKKHIKFDDASGNLFLQLKHFKDNDWINISYEKAKREQDKCNELREKKSHLFKPPAPADNTAAGSSNGGSSANKIVTGSTSVSYTHLTLPTIYSV